MKNIAIIAPNIGEYKTIHEISGYPSDVKFFWAGYEYNEIMASIVNTKPDLLLLSMNFTIIDIPKLIKDILSEYKCPLIVYIDESKKADGLIFDALNAGATDYIKLVLEEPDAEQNKELNKKFSKIINSNKISAKINEMPKSFVGDEKQNLVIIGSSTGGPAALMEIIKKLPKMTNSTIVIIQHIEPDYIQALVEWLSYHSINLVEVAQNNYKLEKGKIYLANGGEHLLVDNQGYFRYTKEPEEYPYKPSINRFFECLAELPQYSGTAVILTGMGRDGSIGLLKLKESKWRTIAQDEKSSVVYGMPKAAKENGAAENILGLNEIADKIAKIVY
jgi:two-component system, chemotaxis family, response regulator WspF